MYQPAEEVGLLDVRGGVAVAAVSVLVVETALPQHSLILGNGLFPTERVESDGVVAFLLFC